MKTKTLIIASTMLFINCEAQNLATNFLNRIQHKSSNERSAVEYLKATTNKNYDMSASVYNLSDTTVYIRDNNGNVTQQNTYLPSISGGLDLTIQNNYTYNSSNNILVETNLNNGFMSGNPLVNNYKRENTYDGNQNLIETKDFTWSNNTWIPQTKTVSTYTNNNLITETSYNWVDSINNYAPSYRTTFTYNSFNQILTVLGELNTSGTFVNDFQTTNVVWANTTEQEYPQSYTEQIWNSNTNSWDNASKFDGVFNTSGKILQENYYNWYTTNWTIFRTETYTYNSNNNLTLEITRVDTSANLIGQLGVQRNRRIYYNSSFVLTTDTIDNLNFFFGQVFQNTSAHTYSFNSNNNMLTDTSFYFNQSTNLFERTTLIRNYYEANTSALQENSKQNFSIFPVPVSNYLNFNCNANEFKYCNIYNSSGSCIFTKEISENSNLIDVSNYSKGIYFIELYANDGKVKSKKFIKN